MPGKWVFTLQAPSIWPFLQYADNRELRQQILTAYTTRSDHGDAVRQQGHRRADGRAAGRARPVARLQDPRRLRPRREHGEDAGQGLRPAEPALDAGARDGAAGGGRPAGARSRRRADAFTLEAWDWRYYPEKVRKARFDLDEQALRPYFQLDNVRQGAFYVANKLYGLTFTPRPDLPVYHPEVQAFEVKDADGSHLGVYYSDYHPRPGKRVGAWSSTLPRHAGSKDGTRVTPVVVNVCNFSRPAGDEPALLSLEEVETLFHEFGHALNSLLSKSPVSGPRRVPARLRRGAVADHGELGARARGPRRSTRSTTRPAR